MRIDAMEDRPGKLDFLRRRCSNLQWLHIEPHHWTIPHQNALAELLSSESTTALKAFSMTIHHYHHYDDDRDDWPIPNLPCCVRYLGLVTEANRPNGQLFVPLIQALRLSPSFGAHIRYLSLVHNLARHCRLETELQRNDTFLAGFPLLEAIETCYDMVPWSHPTLRVWFTTPCINASLMRFASLEVLHIVTSVTTLGRTSRFFPSAPQLKELSITLACDDICDNSAIQWNGFIALLSQYYRDLCKLTIAVTRGASFGVRFMRRIQDATGLREQRETTINRARGLMEKVVAASSSFEIVVIGEEEALPFFDFCFRV